MRQRTLITGLLLIAVGVLVPLLLRTGASPDSAVKPGADAPTEPPPAPGLAGLPAKPRELEEVIAHEAPAEQIAPKKEAAQPPESAQVVIIRVVNEDGDPVDGVGIVAYLPMAPGPPSPRIRHLGSTDLDGEFRFRPPSPAIRIGVDPEGEWHCGKTYALPEDREVLVLHVVSNVLLRGTVVGEDGSPVEGAHVLVRFWIRSRTGTSRMAFERPDPTDGDGRFEMTVPAYVREVILDVRHAGAIASETVDPRTSTALALHLRKPVRISGVVVGPDGEEITGPRVMAIPSGGGEAINGGLQGGANGFFVSVPRAGRYLLVFKSERVFPLLGPDPLEVEAPVEGLRVVYRRGLPLKGHVEGTDSKGFRVMWQRKRGPDPRTVVHHWTRVDADGRFTFVGLADGDTILYFFRRDDDRFALLERVRLPDQDLKVTLRRGLSVEGSVVGYEGRDGFDLSLVLSWRGPSRSAKVQEDGSFVFRGLPPGTYELSWHRSGKKAALGRTVEAGGPAIEVRIPGIGSPEGN